MSETNQQPTNIFGIPFEAKIAIEVGGGLYARLSQLMTHWAAQKSVAEFTAVLAFLQLPDSKPRNEYEYHIVTMLSILYEIEIKAKEQNQLVEKDISEYASTSPSKP